MKTKPLPSATVTTNQQANSQWEKQSLWAMAAALSSRCLEPSPDLKGSRWVTSSLSQVMCMCIVDHRGQGLRCEAEKSARKFQKVFINQKLLVIPAKYHSSVLGVRLETTTPSLFFYSNSLKSSSPSVPFFTCGHYSRFWRLPDPGTLKWLFTGLWAGFRACSPLLLSRGQGQQNFGFPNSHRGHCLNKHESLVRLT